MANSCSAPKRQNGFILLAVLWVLTVLALIAGAFSVWLEGALERATRATQALQGEVDGASTRATMLYLLSTRPMTPSGLVVSMQPPGKEAFNDDVLDGTIFAEINDDTVVYKTFGTEMAVDDRPYFGLGSAIVSVQDHAGLVDLNLAPDHVLSALLATAGVPEIERLPLIEKLRDFIDGDELHRLNGAERYHYERMGLRPPENQPLSTPAEVQQVMGWKERVDLSPMSAFMRSVTVGQIGAINVNAATISALQTLPGFSAEMARSVIRYRRKSAIFGLQDLALAAGLPAEQAIVGEMPIQTSPSGKFRISLWYPSASVVTQYNLELTPFDHEGRPWRLLWGVLGPITVPDESEPVQYTQTALFAQPSRSAEPDRQAD